MELAWRYLGAHDSAADAATAMAGAIRQVAAAHGQAKFHETITRAWARCVAPRLGAVRRRPRRALAGRHLRALHRPQPGATRLPAAQPLLLSRAARLVPGPPLLGRPGPPPAANPRRVLAPPVKGAPPRGIPALGRGSSLLHNKSHSCPVSLIRHRIYGRLFALRRVFVVFDENSTAYENSSVKRAVAVPIKWG